MIRAHPDFSFADEFFYLDIASHVATENTYASSGEYIRDELRQSPGLPIMLGLAGKFLPLTPVTAKSINACASILASLLYALAAWKILRHPAPALAVLALTGLHPTVLFTSVTNYPQAFLSLWWALLALAWAFRMDNPASRPSAGLLDGLLIGIGALFVPTHIFAAPAALAFHAHRPRAWFFRYVAWAALGGILALTPWTVRNLRVEKAFIPFSTNGGGQFWLGFNEQAGMNTGVQIEEPPALRDELMQADSSRAAERILRAAAWKWIRENPAAAVRLYGLKALNFFRWDNGRLATRHVSSSLREWLTRLTSLGVFGLWGLGLWLSRRSPDRVWGQASAVLLLALALGHAFFISRYRYRLPYEPFLLFVGILGCGRRGPAFFHRSSS